eukprot:CAMPEP_0170295040 /NCGR_PEP_ID=MMETSP0116_2-20130129/47641_1 /TAXON_ID=400756 /ORGANISM="Durinskia baltica, Strain CSIRO CS-38" /LENGTH=459 /DNA_ID=CAMNT_0010546585 /DNA_START=44 /DNA_END=1421 /DNA_ORIENTATION=-
MPPRPRYKRVVAVPTVVTSVAYARLVPAPRVVPPTSSTRSPVVFKHPGCKDELCAFFRGTGTDIECRSLEQILTWDNQLLEVCHDYIQWLLPTDEASKFNTDAPILDPECQRIFRDDPVIRRNLRRGAQRFLCFLGLAANLDVAEEVRPRIIKAPNFEQRLLMCWRGPANHNWKRVSRALRCFGLVGMEDVQQALLSCLEEIIVQHPGMIDEVTIGHWLDEACTKSKLVHSITPGYLAALMTSPYMMKSLCRQYFSKYDANGDGRLQSQEICALTAELHSSLGLPTDTIDDATVVKSILAYSDDGSLSEKDFPVWFSHELKIAIGQSEKVKVEEPLPEKFEPEEQHRPEYLAALLRSPKLLASSCQKYFQMYDTNHNGVVELSEAVKMSLELQNFLGLPPNFNTQQQIMSSLARFSKCRRNNALDEKSFPAWFQFALKTAAAGGTSQSSLPLFAALTEG